MSELGLVLGGGAARGAYEAGVLQYLVRRLPERLGWVPWPDVIAGTSVGALNGAFAAAQDVDLVDRLVQMYATVRIEDVVRIRGRRISSSLIDGLRGDGPFALLDPSPINGLIESRYPGPAVWDAIDSGRCRAFMVTGTDLRTGQHTLFIDTAAPGTIEHIPGSRSIFTRVTYRHCQATGALPFLFPPVPVGDSVYIDGGLRNNTPLRPLLHAGVDKVFVIGLKRVTPVLEPADVADVIPDAWYLLGKGLHTLLLDPIGQDLHAAQRVNRIIAWGERNYGPGFADAIRRDLGLREVKTLFLYPSVDLGELAATLLHEHAPLASASVRWLLRTIADSGRESDLLSFLYYDRSYTRQLLRLGFEDARAREDEIVAFLEE